MGNPFDKTISDPQAAAYPSTIPLMMKFLGKTIMEKVDLLTLEG